MRKRAHCKRPDIDECEVYGEGARRLVYDLGYGSSGSVLKVPKSKFGIISNKREVKLFRTSSWRLKKHLGTIREYGRGYKWVKMKKYTRLFPTSKKYARKLKKLRKLFRRYGIYPYEVVSRRGEPNYQNLRLNRHGVIKVIDYGNFQYSRGRKSRRRTCDHSS